ncbi:ribonuclease H-like domain-containing protein [Tanacetum coccineum]|uniref:Ribonuclease H-like domain-containing protein n=1 Tax=Tanacetum coccineum TaxID=301880 RepID=A0ABQ5CVS0_9ASTR
MQLLMIRSKMDVLRSAKVSNPGFMDHLQYLKMILERVNITLEVILNVNKVLKRTVGETKQEYEPTTAEEKQDKRNKLKAKGTLLMALLNKDQLKFHSYKDSKLLMEAIEKRYGGNKESKKVQRTLLKQQYENFAGSSLETIDQTFDRLQKLISQLEIQGEVITQEDMNLKLLRSLPSKWKTHALIGRNKEEIEAISLDELYNNLKIYKPELAGSSSISQNTQNVAFVSSNSTNSNSSTNEADDTTYGVSSAHTQSNPTSGDNLSNVVICAFLASQPNSPQLVREDLEQIDPDDLEEMDLQWEMAMLTIRARRFIQRIDKKLDVNGQRVGFDRTKVECYNCHKNGHFARECRAPRNQENRGRENNRRTVTVETPTENAFVAQDGIGGYDWSYQAEEEHPINFALMAHSSSGSSSSSNSEITKSLNLIYNMIVSYKAGLESVEARLAHYKKNEVVFEESINVLNLEVKLRDNALVENKKKLEKAEKERDELKLTLEKFQNSSKSLNNLLETFPTVESFVNSSEMLENQEYNKFKSDKGYHATPLPYIGNFIPFKPVLTFMDEIVKIEPKTIKKNSFRPPVIEDWNFDDDSEVEIIPNVKDKVVRPSTKKIKFIKSARETVEKGNPQQKEYKEKGVIDSGCSRHMTGNKCYLTEYEDYDGGFVSFGDGKGRISGKVLSSDFKLLDESQVLLRVPRKDNIYSVDLKSVVPTKGETLLEVCLQRFLKMTILVLLVRKESNTKPPAEEVNTACYVLNRVLVIKPHTKTPYELIYGKTPMTDFMNPFGYPVTILNTRDHLGKFDGKADEGFFVGYSVVGKAMRVFNKRTRIVKETLNIRFLENVPNMTGNGPDWFFDVDSLTISINYVTVVAGNQTNGPKDSEEDSGMKPLEMDVNGDLDIDAEDDQATRSDTLVSTAGLYFTNDAPSSPVNAARTSKEHLFEQFSPFKNAFTLLDVPNVFSIDDTGIFGNAYDDKDVGAAADLNNLETTMNVSPILTTRINKDHPKDQIIGDLTSAIQTRRMTKISDEHAMMDVKSAFLYGTIKEEVYVDDIIFGSIKKSLCDEFEGLMHKRFQMSSMGELAFFLGLQIASTPIENNKALVMDEEAEVVDVYLYRSMIRSLMYLTASRPDIMFVVCACARFQVTPKTSHIHVMKRIFRYLKGQPKLGIWYTRDSPFDLEVFSDSDYASASLDNSQ